MDFKCNFCEKKFSDFIGTIQHLKKEHKITENNDRIKCIVDFQKPDYCRRSYLTFSGLKTHVKSCVITKHEHDKEVNNMK